eukprot:SAG31_NODE_171_length_21415_cov_7.512807_4_plen_125_part_00
MFGGGGGGEPCCHAQHWAGAAMGRATAGPSLTQLSLSLIVGVLVTFILLSEFLSSAYRWTIGATLLAALGGIMFATYLADWMMSLPEGSPKMVEIATFIRQGADGALLASIRTDTKSGETVLRL